MLEPINIILFFLTIFLISFEVSFVHLVIFPSINFPDDFPWPEYSNAKKPKLFFLQILKKFWVFDPLGLI